MALSSLPRLRILSVGGNSVSAFLSWRLQATNACDVTLVWKNGYEHVSQYGISFKSRIFGNERFKPYSVVANTQDASQGKAPFDYVFLCVKALPDIFDIASVIDSVVTAHHTCILVNTTQTLGTEAYLEQRFPTNVVLSLVSGAEITQLGPSEFEHKGSTGIWIGAANSNLSVPNSIQSDMAEALAMTLSSSQVDCKVSPNIRQQQFEVMIGPIAFHPATVIFETPNHSELVEKVGVRSMIIGIMDELVQLASAFGCTFPPEFQQRTFDSMIQSEQHEHQSAMYHDYISRRPMEIESYLGAPLKLAQQHNIAVPRLETLYATLHHINLTNLSKSKPAPPLNAANAPPRVSSVHPKAPPPSVMTNGNSGTLPPNHPGGPVRNGMRMSNSRQPSMGNGSYLPGQIPPPHMQPPMPGPHPGMRRAQPPRLSVYTNGYSYPNNAPVPKRSSFDGADLEEFSHLVLYDSQEGNDVTGASLVDPNRSNGPNDLALRERELLLRQRELALREQELNLRRNQQMHRRHHASVISGFDEDEDDDEFDVPPSGVGPHNPIIDSDDFDMMSITSRRTRKSGHSSQQRKLEMSRGSRSRHLFRPNFSRNKNRFSSQIVAEMPGLHDSIMDDALMGYSSNRYGDVDRSVIQSGSRANSLTASRPEDPRGMGAYHHGYPPPPRGEMMGMNHGGAGFSRRSSQSPGNPLSAAAMRQGGRPSPPNGYHGGGGGSVHRNGRPSPLGVRAAGTSGGGPRHSAGGSAGGNGMSGNIPHVEVS